MFARGKIARAAVLAAAFAALTVPAVAQNAAPVPVPLPNLRPETIPTARPQPAPSVAAPQPDATAAISQRPVAIDPNSKFSAEEQVALARIDEYFRGVRTMEGEFVQFGPTGEQSEGVFFLSRPGKIRFHYRPPARLDVIADGSSVAINDGRANTQDLYPLSKTPLRYLLADDVDLTDQNLIDSVRQEPDLISLLIVERSPLVQGKLTLIFDRKTYELRQWIVTDAQGYNTAVAIYNVSVGKPQDSSLFRINVLRTRNED